MLRRQHHVGGAEDRVRAGGEHLDGLALTREPDPRTGRPADPVALHLLQRLGPVHAVQVGQQAVGVGGDPHHPLGQRAPEHREVAPLRAAVGGDLLVGQHRAQPGAPVDRGLVQVGQPVRVDHLPARDLVQVRPRQARRVRAGGGGPGAGVQLGHQLLDRAGLAGVGVEPGAEDLQEDPLRPLVVARVDRREAAAVVVVDAQPAQLGPDRLDVRLGRDPRVLAGLDGVLLGGQAEGVVAHGVQDVVPVHAQEPAGDVGAQVAQRVPDVQPGARGVREHVHHERLGPVGDALEAVAERADRVGRVERPVGLPAVLPGQLDLLGQRGRVPVRRDAVGRRVGARLAGRLAHGRCSRVIWCARTGGGQKKTPHAWRGRRAVRTVSGQHGRRSRSRPVTGPSLPRRGGARPTSRTRTRHPSEAKAAALESSRTGRRPMRSGWNRIGR